MRPAGDIERLLHGLEDQTSEAFDDRTLRDMYSALDAAARTAPGRSWRRIRIIGLAAAAVLAVGIGLLAWHLISRQAPLVPGPENRIASDASDQQTKELRLAKELLVKSDTQGLLRLLDTGLDHTKIVAAGCLAQLGDRSALPALRNLAAQWQGPAEDNPFLRSIEQIESISPKQDKAAPGTPPQEQAPSNAATLAPSGSAILVRVTDKATGQPIPQATIRTLADGKEQVDAADDDGVFILDLGPSIPDYANIFARPEGYVWQVVALRDLKPDNLPKTIQFSLERGIAIGAVVQDSQGRPIEGASVESYSISDQPYQQPSVIVRIEQKTDAQGRWRSGANVPREIDRLWFNVRHPDFADDGFEMPKDLKFEDLKAGRAVMVLDKGIAVVGRVVDMTGKPVAGAKLLAGEDYFANDWTQTDESGHFQFLHLQPLNRSFLLTVQAPGFVPQRKELPTEDGLAPVDFVLAPARLLIGRVVDAAGKPIAGAFICTEDWNGSRTVKWQGYTGAQGMFTWDYPPADAITIRIGKSGYREFEGKVVANDQEQTFVLAKPVTIKGSVTDSETGETVNLFKVTPGAHWTGSKATWQTSEGWVKWSTDGQYSYTFSGDARDYAVRIEAEGYLPFESRFVDANEQDVTMDIALSKGRGPTGYVFDANAAPVEGAEVFWHSVIMTQNGQMINRTHLNGATTDREGCFAFKPENRADPLAAFSDRGMGVVSYEDFAKNGIITLTPWARVQGELRIGTRPAVNQRLHLTSQVRLAGNSIQPENETTTDEQGRFVFDRVYPGTVTLYNRDYEVAPGQTLDLHLGGTGRTVRGELALPVPSDTAIWSNLELVTMGVPAPFDKWPVPPGYERMSSEQVEAWFERFGQSAEGKAYGAWLEQTYPQTTRYLRIQMDGRTAFHVDNVEPGTYVLKGVIRPSPTHDSSRLNEVLGRLWQKLEVPPFTSQTEMDTPLDLGTLAVQPPGELKPGDPAPSFEVPACGPGSIRLIDYQGKVLLVTFCSSGIAYLKSPAMQNLKAVYQHFHEDPRYAQVSLLFAGNPLVAAKAVHDAGLEWPHGLLEWQGKVVTDYDVKTTPWTVLIGPRGEVLALGLSGEALQQAIEQALSDLP